MTNQDDPLSAEIATNYSVFAKKLPELVQMHAGKFAVMRGGEIIEFLDTFGDAVRFGARLFEDHVFSVQEVTDRRKKSLTDR